MRIASSLNKPEEFTRAERRRAPRHPFGGVAEISAVSPRVCIVARTAEISRLGCFVRTPTSVPAGTKISLKITYEGEEFNTSAEVVYVLPQKGMGIKFAVTATKDEAMLETWLRETMV